MQFRVRVLRYRGQRLPWRDVMNGPSYVGDLCTHLITHQGQQFKVATLRGPAVPNKARLDLYEPVLDGFSTLAFRLRGFERHAAEGGGWVSVVQEWHIEPP